MLDTSSPQPTAPAPSSPVSTATGLLGTPYVWGGQSAKGTDCSGLIQQAYPKMPRLAHDQKNASTPVNQADLQAGDLAFLHGTQHHPQLPDDYASHVGIYDGNGNIIHASSVHGKVVSVPISHFTNSPNFYGFGRPPGNSPMPKTSKKSVGLAVQPPQGGMAQGNLAMQLQGSQNGADGQQQASMPFYTPYSPTTTQVGNAPTVDDAMAMMYGAPVDPSVNWSDQQTQTTPSLNNQMLDHRQKSLDAAVLPSDLAAEQAKSKAGLMTAYAKMLENHPAAQYHVAPLPDMPTQKFADIPTRPAPGFDPMTSSLGALAGILNPHFAGQFGAAPMQAAIAVANQQNADNQTRYHQATQQMAQQYENEMQQYNATVGQNRAVSNANYSNDEANQKAGIALGGAKVDANNADDYANVLSGPYGLQERGRLAATEGQKADELQNTIGMQLGQNAATINQQNIGNANAIKLLDQQNKFLMNQVTNSTKATVGAAHDDSRETVGQDRNATSVTNTNTRAATSIATANIRASAVANRVSKDLNGMTAAQKIQIQPYAQMMTNAAKEAEKAENGARARYGNDFSPNKPDVETYVTAAGRNARTDQATATQKYQDALTRVLGPTKAIGSGKAPSATRHLTYDPVTGSMK